MSPHHDASQNRSGTFQVIPVQSAAEQELFLAVPSLVYANDRNWVQPLRSEVVHELSKEYPFRQYGTLQPFIAVREGKAIGRVVASVNRRLIESEGKQVGLFGYFECISEFEVGQALLAAACDWLRQQGMAEVRGPINFSTQNSCFFLIDGFDSPPMIMMPYNPPHYPQFMEQDGWQKAKDSYSYRLPLDRPLPPEFEKGYHIALKSGVTFRPIRTEGEGFNEDVIGLYNLYTKAFANNWSSTKRSQQEFVEQAQSLKSLVDPDVFPIAEYNGEMIGFFMSLPDYNLALKHVNGKLNWLGILKFLWYRRQINRGRVIAISSLPEFKRKLVPLALIYLGLQGGVKKGKPYEWADLGWVFEDNMPSRKLIEASGGKIYKTYRIYEKAL